jgi:hypothetical protein
MAWSCRPAISTCSATESRGVTATARMATALPYRLKLAPPQAPLHGHKPTAASPLSSSLSAARPAPSPSPGGGRFPATPDLSVSRSDRDIDRQVQLDETRLQQRHGQIILQFDPGVGIAWSAATPLEDDLAGLPQLGVEAGSPYAVASDRRVPYTVRAAQPLSPASIIRGITPSLVVSAARVASPQAAGR